MRLKSKGFTLIELMIVISIITILATMAVPTFQDRIIRTQVEEGLQMAEFVQESVASFYQQFGRMPSDNQEAGLPPSDKIIGNYISAIEVRSGVVNLKMGNRVNNHANEKIISIRPAVVEGQPKVPIAWIYGYASLPEGMKAVGENQSTILSRHLPVRCRY